VQPLLHAPVVTRGRCPQLDALLRGSSAAGDPNECGCSVPFVDSCWSCRVRRPGSMRCHSSRKCINCMTCTDANETTLPFHATGGTTATSAGATPQQRDHASGWSLSASSRMPWNRTLDRYRSPKLGMIVTTSLPSFSGREATCARLQRSALRQLTAGHLRLCTPVTVMLLRDDPWTAARQC